MLVAKLTGVQHAFWVVLGTLSVLRSNALNTGQNVVRGLLGTVAGSSSARVLVALIGTNTTLLWFLLPLAVLLAGLAPAAISFAAGQAAFTRHAADPVQHPRSRPGWQLGLVRIEDVAIGCAREPCRGLAVLAARRRRPRSARRSPRRTPTARTTSRERVEFGMGRCDGSGPAPPAAEAEALRARPPPPGASTTPSAATWPSAGRSPCRWPR